MDLISIRRDLHAHPELSHQEERTAKVVADHLRALGLVPQTGVAGHGVVALVEGEHDGPTMLYRADMDALPIQEELGRSYGSKHPGVMHACGHDVHTTIGLGVAEAIVQRRAELRGAVKLVFQPAEEAAPPPGQVIGAERMVEEGVLRAPEVDAAFALHVMPQLDVGTIGYTRGAVWAASDLFDIEIVGHMAHGAYPQEGRDPIYAATLVVQAIQQIATRDVDARDACVISVCQITAGSAYNIIPERASLRGLIRTLDPAVRTRVLQRFDEIVTGVAAACGCVATTTIVRGTHATINDLDVESFVVSKIQASGVAQTVPFRAQINAEDFAAISRRVPSAYLFLGVRNEALGIHHMIHTPRFDVDERCLAIGRDAMVHALLAFGKRRSDDTQSPSA